jgi:hypothetical protein
MTLTLKESCRLYEQHCRRNLKVPTFEEFNGKHATCLPSNPVVYKEFKTTLELAHKADGLPVTRRLVNLWTRLSKTPSSKSMALSSPSLQVPVPQGPVSMVPDPSLALKMNIRAPTTQPGLSKKKPWSLEKYKKLVQNSPSQKLKESSGLMVHLVPTSPVEDLTALACKLTKNNWNVLIGQDRTATLSMRDGSNFDLCGVELNKDDVVSFKQEHKKNKQGPYFIRFSCI